MQDSFNQQPVRLDKWLWAARFFKTRNMATEAIAGGKVHVNGARVKPSRNVNIDDELTITKGAVHFTVVVKGLADRRGPAKVAESLYEETAESRERREREQAARKELGRAMPQFERRPDKKDRRRIIRMKQGGS